MLIKNAIAYLEDTSVKASDRFKVLTGFDTKANDKDRDPSYWFNALYLAKIIEKLEKAKATSSISGFFSSISGAVSGNNLQGQLKEAYKKASTESDEQIEGQEEYIGIVADYLKENQDAECLVRFDFTDPKKLLSRLVEPASANSYS